MYDPGWVDSIIDHFHLPEHESLAFMPPAQIWLGLSLILLSAYFFVQLVLSTYGRLTFSLIGLCTIRPPYFCLTTSRFWLMSRLTKDYWATYTDQFFPTRTPSADSRALILCWILSLANKWAEWNRNISRCRWASRLQCHGASKDLSGCTRGVGWFSLRRNPQVDQCKRADHSTPEYSRCHSWYQTRPSERTSMLQRSRESHLWRNDLEKRMWSWQ